MAITTINLTIPRKDRSGRTPFAVFFTSANVTACEIIKAASTGQIYLEKLKIWCNSAITVTLGEGITSGAPTANLIGPIDSIATAGPPRFDFDFKRELQLTATRDLTIDASGAGTVYGFVEGFIID